MSIKAVSFEITFTEAGDRHLARYTSWAHIDAALWRISIKAPTTGSYHKTDVVVTWENGETYKARLDITGNDIPRLGAHMRRYCEMHAGKRRPDGWTDAEYARYLDDCVSPARRAEYAALLSEYDFGQE